MTACVSWMLSRDLTDPRQSGDDASGVVLDVAYLGADLGLLRGGRQAGDNAVGVAREPLGVRREPGRLRDIALDLG